MAFAQESAGLQSKDPDGSNPSRVLAEDDDPSRSARPWMKRRFFVVFLGCSLVFHLSLISIVILFDPARQLSMEVIEIPVELVSQADAPKTGPKDGSGQGAGANAQSPARQNQSPAGPNGSAAKPEPKPAAAPDKAADAQAKPPERQADKPPEAKPPEAKAAEDKPPETKTAEKKPEENRPEQNKPAETKAAESKPAEDKQQPAPKAAAPKQQPAPSEPKPAERKPAAEQAAAAKAAQPQPSRQMDRQQAQPPIQSREEARRVLAAAGILPEQDPQNRPTPQEAEQQQQQQASALPKFFQPNDKLSLAIPAPIPTDEPDAEQVGYKLVVFGQLAREKQYPAAARARHSTGHVVVSFSVDDAGQPQGIALIQSSGDADLDTEALSMITRAAPFPIPPAGAQRQFGIDVGFSLDDRSSPE